MCPRMDLVCPTNSSIVFPEKILRSLYEFLVSISIIAPTSPSRIRLDIEPGFRLFCLKFRFLRHLSKCEVRSQLMKHRVVHVNLNNPIHVN